MAIYPQQISSIAVNAGQDVVREVQNFNQTIDALINVFFPQGEFRARISLRQPQDLFLLAERVERALVQKDRRICRVFQGIAVQLSPEKVEQADWLLYRFSYLLLNIGRCSKGILAHLQNSTTRMEPFPPELESFNQQCTEKAERFKYEFWQFASTLGKEASSNLA